VANKIEEMRKESFLGRASQDKAFKRWLQIFNTFSDGMALVKGSDK
jgi:hypothetical protein